MHSITAYRRQRVWFIQQSARGRFCSFFQFFYLFLSFFYSRLHISHWIFGLVMHGLSTRGNLIKRDGCHRVARCAVQPGEGEVCFDEKKSDHRSTVWGEKAVSKLFQSWSYIFSLTLLPLCKRTLILSMVEKDHPIQKVNSSPRSNILWLFSSCSGWHLTP